MPTPRIRSEQIAHLFVGDGPASLALDGAHKEVIGGVFPTSVVWWTSMAKTAKVLEKTITRNAQQLPTSVTWTIYDTDGATVLRTVTDAITYSGVAETSRDRSIS